MMKLLFKLSLLCLLPAIAKAQLPSTIAKYLKNAKTDSAKFSANFQASSYFIYINTDSANFYTNKAIELATKNKKQLDLARASGRKGFILSANGKFGASYTIYNYALILAENPKNANSEWQSWNYSNEKEALERIKSFSPEKYRLNLVSNLNQGIGTLYARMENYKKGIYYTRLALELANEFNSKTSLAVDNLNLTRYYCRIDRLDSASYFLNQISKYTNFPEFKNYLGAWESHKGFLELKKGNLQKAKFHFYLGIPKSIEVGNLTTLNEIYVNLTSVYLRENNKDSSLFFAKKVKSIIPKLGNYDPNNNIGIAYENLYKCYLLRQETDSATKYAGLAFVAKDKYNKTRISNLTEFQNLFFNDRLRLQALEKEKVINENKIRVIGLGIGLLAVLIIAFILYQSNRQKHKANSLLSSALNNLKSTQTQLIQSEKMASLGELTAGIAHEIQNPLNFVNNFSEVNKEMIEELEDELKSGNIDDALLIAADIKQNEEKINHHGKRADAIVKGMLEHSRAGSGVKEPTDINKLADEYLRLSYHGLRAKDKTFNAEMVTNFDENLPLINVIPQDIGRVMLNLFNNAFYAVHQKAKTAGADYNPKVVVETFFLPHLGVEGLKVKDNGIGIPDAIKDKIMQPFFTTKPTGEGTGLGLSLTYDMVVKGHGGKIEVNSKDGEGSEFIVTLPFNI